MLSGTRMPTLRPSGPCSACILVIWSPNSLTLRCCWHWLSLIASTALALRILMRIPTTGFLWWAWQLSVTWLFTERRVGSDQRNPDSLEAQRPRTRRAALVVGNRCRSSRLGSRPRRELRANAARLLHWTLLRAACDHSAGAHSCSQRVFRVTGHASTIARWRRRGRIDA